MTIYIHIKARIILATTIPHNQSTLQAYIVITPVKNIMTNFVVLVNYGLNNLLLLFQTYEPTSTDLITCQ